MHVTIKRFDTSLPIPEYQTAGAAALDLYARERTVIASHQVQYVPLNIALQLPDGYWVLLAARSSLHKKGLMLANGIGVGDHDYRGDGDEYKAAMFNFSDREVVVERGERVCQMIVLPRERVEFEVVEKFDAENRGGFGTTGKK